MYLSYKITNIINGKYYIGVHKTNDPNDDYMGSGVAIKNAMKKYGRQSFNKTIIETFESESEMYEWESLNVNQEIVDDPKSYNMTMGGKGGFSHIDCSGDNNPMRNPMVAKKVSMSLKGSDHWRKGQKLATAAAKLTNTGRKRPEHSKKMINNSLKKPCQWVAVSPEGYSYTFPSLANFCDEKGFTRSSIYGAVKRGDTITNGSACGWWFGKLDK